VRARGLMHRTVRQQALSVFFLIKVKHGLLIHSGGGEAETRCKIGGMGYCIDRTKMKIRYFNGLKIENEEDKLMKLNKILVCFIAIAAIFCFAGTALATDRVEVKVTSEPIGFHALCDKAGGFSLSFDTDTELMAGDVITVDMPVIPSIPEQVTLCKSFDIDISPSGAGSFWTALGGLPGAGDTLISTGGNLDISLGVSAGIWFRVQGVADQSRVTVSVMGAPGDGIKVGPAAADTITLMFLDQKLNPGAPPSSMWLYDTVLDVRTNTAASNLVDNTLCINVLNWSPGVVLANLDSALDKFTFIPSNPQIAHIINSAYQEVDCKAKEAGHIPEGATTTTQTGGTVNCPIVDNDDDADGTGYCSAATIPAAVGPYHNRNYFIVERSIGTWDLVDYQIKMEILVNDSTADNGWYFTNEPVLTATAGGVVAPTIAGLCNYTAPGGAVAVAGAYVYGPAITGAAPDTRTAAGLQCDVPATARTTTLLSPLSNLGLGAGDKFLLLDIPAIQYDIVGANAVSVGDVVKVRITIMKAPCGTVYQGTIVIGTYGCLTAPPAATISCMTFPYFTPVNDAEWWAGIALTNLAATDATAKIKIYETDGDQGFVEVPLNGLSQYTALLSSLTFTQTAGTGTIGDSRSFVIVCVTGSNNVDGFGMLGDGLQGQGYLPRTGLLATCGALCP